MREDPQGKPRLAIVLGGRDSGSGPNYGSETTANGSTLDGTVTAKSGKRYLVNLTSPALRQVMARKCEGLVGEFVHLSGLINLDADVLDDHVDTVLRRCLRRAYECGIVCGREMLVAEISKVRSYLATSHRHTFFDVIDPEDSGGYWGA